jgi:threonine/homoserine/homoserine lactone efflux protein
VPDSLPTALTGLGLGLALGASPGPVQAVLITEAVRGGIGRGFRAMAGANLTYGLLLVLLALGFSVLVPSSGVVRVLEIAGGLFLLWLALDGFRSAGRPATEAKGGRTPTPPALRGAVAVVLNPGGWLFLATVATSVFAAAAEAGGTPNAVLTALGLIAGIAVGDAAIVLFGGLGVRRAGDRVRAWVQRALAVLLAALAFWLLLRGLVG